MRDKPVDEIYISTDIEANGPIPGVFSMLSFASAAFTLKKELVSTFSANLSTLPRAKEDPDTMQWWKNKKKAWAAARKDPQKPHLAMKAYLQWLKGLPGRPVFVAYPAAFDYTFIAWYLIKFTGENPFSYVALDIKTYACALLKKPFFKTTKKAMPRRWFDENKKSHIALEDAIEQGHLFCNMLGENLGPSI
jgi:hypothetical protein